jgi:hypothetical protein
VLFVTNRRLRTHIENEGRFSSKHLACYKCNNASRNSEGLFLGLRNLNFITVGRKVQMFSQEYATHEVSGCGNGEYICYLELATGGPR